MRRLFPHPLLSVCIAIVWVFLANEVTPGLIIMGAVLGFLIPLYMADFWPGRPRMRAPLTLLAYLLILLWDVVVSNLYVAKLILFRRGDSLRSTYVTVPLELETPEAIAVLTGTIALTPGTVCVDISSDGKVLLVHCLDYDDPQEVVTNIKDRYEQRLKRIFE
ncbi:Na+/H+ antiporter subunit E [Xanthobacter sp. TB0139]|uniref:Na+/H+ antiporter subunit E n=1 Tax=Xanthobacter sp. TB0139 TaxID=3459178 RepID=UPI0040396095